MNNLLNINALAFMFLIFTATLAEAANWVSIGNVKGINYYVDLDRQRVDGPFWTAPISAQSKDGRFSGEVVIDCRDKTSKMRLENYFQDWRPIAPGSPLGNIVREVCN
jgi:hypothetical protein